MTSGHHILAQRMTDAKRDGWAKYVRSEADEHAVMNGCWYDEKAGTRWVRFFERILKHTRGDEAGKPFRLLPWQRDDVIMPLFGWKTRNSAGEEVRRYRKGGVWISKKNGKSTLAGGIANGFMQFHGPRAECYGVAHTKDQAKIVYREAAEMASASPLLAKSVTRNDTLSRLVVKKTSSFFSVLAGENGARAAEGINPVLILFDELHVQRDRKLFDALTYACAAQKEALILSISTVGVADETTIWWEQFAYGKGILEGRIFDDAYFAYVAQADEACKDKPEMLLDPVEQKKANPSLDEPGCLTSDELSQAVLEAQNSPAKMNNLLRYRFNIPTAQLDNVVNMQAWDACSARETAHQLIGNRAAFAGLDLSSQEDLTALIWIFKPHDYEEDQRYVLIARFWVPEEQLHEREKKNQFYYSEWVREKWLRVTPGKRVNQQMILDDIRDDLDQFRAQEAGYDQWAAEWIVQQLENEVDMVKVQQSRVGMTQGTKAFLSAIEDGNLVHDGNPVMRWCCSNAAADDGPDWIKFDKKKAADKIDGAVAAAIAMGRAAVGEVHTSIYDKPGGLFL